MGRRLCNPLPPGHPPPPELCGPCLSWRLLRKGVLTAHNGGLLLWSRPWAPNNALSTVGTPSAPLLHSNAFLLHSYPPTPRPSTPLLVLMLSSSSLGWRGLVYLGEPEKGGNSDDSWWIKELTRRRIQHSHTLCANDSAGWQITPEPGTKHKGMLTANAGSESNLVIYNINSFGSIWGVLWMQYYCVLVYNPTFTADILPFKKL